MHLDGSHKSLLKVITEYETSTGTSFTVITAYLGSQECAKSDRLATRLDTNLPEVISGNQGSKEPT